METRTTTIEMLDFGCVSCSRALEHAGRRIKGVRDIRVDLAEHVIRVTHDEDATDVAEQVIAMVNRIGHDAAVRQD